MFKLFLFMTDQGENPTFKPGIPVWPISTVSHWSKKIIASSIFVFFFFFSYRSIHNQEVVRELCEQLRENRGVDVEEWMVNRKSLV